jgi:hypothetical protein
MDERSAFYRGFVVGVLLMMVVRSVVWLVTPWEHPDATTGRYALNVVNIAICAFTAWSTARADDRLMHKLDRIVKAMGHLTAIRPR